jgi:hypothetical protein
MLHIARTIDVQSDPTVSCPAVTDLNPTATPLVLLREDPSAARLSDRYRLLGAFPDEASAMAAAPRGASVVFNAFGAVLQIKKADEVRRKKPQAIAAA